MFVAIYYYFAGFMKKKYPGIWSNFINVTSL